MVQYKQQSRLDEKRKKAMDMHLSFIVDQTEKYSTWLTEGLTAAAAAAAPAPVESSSATVANAEKSSLDPDGLFVLDDCITFVSHFNCVSYGREGGCEFGPVS